MRLFRRQAPDTGYSDKLAAFVNKEYDRRMRDRRPWELVWRRNLAFLDGDQYVEIDNRKMDLVEIEKMYWWQEREVFNQIAPIIDVRVAKLVRNRHILKVRPPTSERKDILAAKVSSKILQSIYYEQNVKDKLADLIWWAESTGTAFAKSPWNANKGRVIAQLEDGTLIHEGDAEFTVHSPFEILPYSPWLKGLANQPSLIHARAYHVDEIEETWGIKIQPEDVDSLSLQAASTAIGGLGYGVGQFRAGHVKLEDHAIVKEYWERPTKKYRKGRLIIVVGDKTIHAGDMPYLVGPNGTPDFPFDQLCSIPDPAKFWGKSVIERAIPLQRRYNALRNRKAEYLNRVAIGQLWVEEGSVDIDDLEENALSPGYIGQYRRGSQKPEPARHEPLPHDFDTELNTLNQEFIILSGVSEIAKQSTAPAGVKSGVALSIALEQDDTRLSATAENIANLIVSQGKKWLRLYKQFADGPRLLRTVGKDNVAEVHAWDSSTINSDDVILEGGSALAESPAQRRQMVFDLLGTGIFNDPETGRLSKAGRVKLLEILDFGNWESGLEEDDLQIAKAERENIFLSQGQSVEIASFDDHILHIQRHNLWRLTTDYEQLAQEHPEIAALAEEHVNAHLDQLMQMAGGQNPIPERQADGVPAPEASAALLPVGEDLRNTEVTPQVSEGSETVSVTSAV